VTRHSPGLQFFEILLDQRWEPRAENVPGRKYDVPKPNIVIASSENRKRVDPNREDALFVRDGGANSLTPRSVGWTERRGESLVTLDVRTTEGRQRLEGHRDPNTREMEDYGGLKGEAQRILDTVRKGDAEYDWIDGFEWRPLSEEMGYANWRGAWEVRLTTLAENIDPSLAP
jgi:hypothetical protein